MRIVLGVCGGIAAYKAAELTRLLQQAGHEVQVVMTAAAGEFIRPLTFAALTGKKVITTLFSGESPSDTLSSAVEHIGVAQEHDVLVVARPRPTLSRSSQTAWPTISSPLCTWHSAAR